MYRYPPATLLFVLENDCLVAWVAALLHLQEDLTYLGAIGCPRLHAWKRSFSYSIHPDLFFLSFFLLLQVISQLNYLLASVASLPRARVVLNLYYGFNFGTRGWLGWHQAIGASDTRWEFTEIYNEWDWENPRIQKMVREILRYLCNLLIYYPVKHSGSWC